MKISLGGPAEPLTLGTNSLEASPNVEDGESGMGFLHRTSQPGVVVGVPLTSYSHPSPEMDFTSNFPSGFPSTCEMSFKIRGVLGAWGELCHPVTETVRVDGTRAQASGFLYRNHFLLGLHQGLQMRRDYVGGS